VSPTYFLSAAIKRKCIQKNQAFCEGEGLCRVNFYTNQEEMQLLQVGWENVWKNVSINRRWKIM